MTVHVMINYSVAPDQVDTNEVAVAAFIAEAKAAADGSYEYSSFRTGDASFVHLGRFADDAAVKRFQSLPGFGDFAAGLKARAIEGPDAARPALVATTRD